MLTTAQRRAHYDDFVAQVIDLCTDNGIRADLASGRGRPVEDCDRMQPHLIRHVAGFGARRSHYTIAGLIAMQRHLAHQQGPYTAEFATHSTDHPSADPDGTTTQTKTIPADATPAATTDVDTPSAGPATGERGRSRPWRSRPNLGASLAIAVARHGFKEPQMTQRVKTLTKLSSPLLHPRLWTLATYLHNHGAARLDFAVLLEDLAWWDYDQRRIATRWRESYFLTLDSLSTPLEH